jgi:hypothetical protein
MLVETDQVLDVDAGGTEGQGDQPVTDTDNPEVPTMDPAALGTTIIGLEAIRADERRIEPPLPRRPRPRPRLEGARQLVATALRRTADAVSPASDALSRAR